MFNKDAARLILLTLVCGVAIAVVVALKPTLLPNFHQFLFEPWTLVPASWGLGPAGSRFAVIVLLVPPMLVLFLLLRFLIQLNATNGRASKNK